MRKIIKKVHNEKMVAIGKIPPTILDLMHAEVKGRKMKGFSHYSTMPTRLKKSDYSFILFTPIVYEQYKEKINRLAKEKTVRILVKRKDDLCKLKLPENIQGVFFDEELRAMIGIIV